MIKRAYTHHRPPCGGGGDPPTLGGCLSHYNENENKYRYFQNTTLVYNPICDPQCTETPCEPPDEPYAIPYLRPVCEGNETQTGCNGETPCGPWPNPPITNSYVSTSLSQSFAKCIKRGRKAVYARKQWHGRFGFAMGDDCCLDEGLPEGATPCSCNPYSGSRRTTKYLGYTFHIEFSYANSSRTFGARFHRSSIVDRYSGLESDRGCYEDYYCDEYIAGFCGCNSDPESELGPMMNELKDFGGSCGHVNIPLFLATNPNLQTEIQDDKIRIYIENQVELDAECGETAFNLNCYIQLDTPYSEQDLNDDVDALLKLWDIEDDVLFPWIEYDTYVGGPLMTYNEVEAQEPHADYCGMLPNTASLPRPLEMPGKVLGKPLPKGYGTYFNFHHISYEQSLGPAGISYVPKYFGAWSPYPHATQWTDEFFDANFPPGPFVAYDTLLNAEKFDTCGHSIKINYRCLTKVLYAETILGTKPSQNFKRPCGVCDRNEQLYDTYDCEAGSGSLRWPLAGCNCDGVTFRVLGATSTTPIMITTSPNITFYDKTPVSICGVEGNTNANGDNYVIERVTNESFRLWYPNGNPVPGNGEYVTGSGVITTHTDKVHYWNDTQPKYEFVVKQWVYDFRKFWSTYEKRQAYYARIEDRKWNPDCPAFDPPPAYNYSESIDGSGRVLIGHGAHFLSKMTNTQHCVMYDPCGPMKVIFDPTNKPYKLSPYKLIVRAPKVPCDDKFGGFWIGRVDQWMSDLLYKPIHRDFHDLKCNEGCEQIVEDDGSCKDDAEGFCYYPLRPYVEARAELPEGAEPLPPFFAGEARPFGCTNYIDKLNQAQPTNAECEPDYPIYIQLDDSGCADWGYYTYAYPIKRMTPWGIQNRQDECIRNEGRFALYYADNSYCEALDVPPP